MASIATFLKGAMLSFPVLSTDKSFLTKHSLEPNSPFDTLAYTWRAASYCDKVGIINQEMSYTLSSRDSPSLKNVLTDGINYDKQCICTKFYQAFGLGRETKCV